MKEHSLAKALAITTSLLMVPVMGIALVFGPNGDVASDVTVLDTSSHTFHTETAAESPTSRDAFVVPETTLPPMPSVESLTPAEPRGCGTPTTREMNQSELRLLDRIREELRIARVDPNVGTPSNRNPPRTLRATRGGHTGNGYTPSQEDVQQRLAAHAEKAQRAEARVQARVEASPAETARELAELARHCYSEGAPQVAESLEASSDQLISFDDAPLDLTVRATFRRRGYGGGDLELKVTRSSNFGQPLAVSFPPGTYGEGLSRAEGRRSSRVFPKAQDLAFLRAPVVLFNAGQSTKTVMVPVACASFGVPSPKADHPYELHRFERGSKVEKLLVAICAGPEKRDSEAQLAVWIARNDLNRGAFNRRARSLRTFHDYQSIGEGDSRGASELLLDGGVDPHATDFFPAPPAAPAPQAKPETPKPRPEPRRAPAEPTVVG